MKNKTVGINNEDIYLFCEDFLKFYQKGDVLNEYSKNSKLYHLNTVKNQDLFIIPHKNNIITQTKKMDRCFCNSQRKRIYRLSETFSAILRQHKAIVFTIQCISKPHQTFFMELFELLNKINFLLRKKNKFFIMGMNLKGSGASTPKHLHVQLIPVFLAGNLTILLNNIERNKKIYCQNEMRRSEEDIQNPIASLIIYKYEFPSYGLQLEYNIDYTQKEIGKFFYNTLTTCLEKKSDLSYNIFIFSQFLNRVNLVFRKTKNECPLRTPHVKKKFLKKINNKYIFHLYKNWHFGWLEMLGCFFPPNNTDNISFFDHSFLKFLLKQTSVNPNDKFIIEHIVFSTKNFHLLKNKVLLTAPARIDLSSCCASDIPLISFNHGGYAINAAVTINNLRPVTVTCYAIPEYSLILYSKDLHQMERITNKKQLYNFQSPLKLLKAAFVASNLIDKKKELSKIFLQQGSGILLITQTNLPIGAGLGISGILAATIIKALYTMYRCPINNNEIVEKAIFAEYLMGSICGWQDPIGGMYGGIKAITCNPNTLDVRVSQFSLKKKFQNKWNKRVVLFYIKRTNYGSDRVSYLIKNHSKCKKRYVTVHKKFYFIHQNIINTIKNANFDKLANYLYLYFEEMSIFDTNYSTRLINKICHSLINLVDGFKLSGAGSGGYIIFIAKKNKLNQLLTQLNGIVKDLKLLKIPSHIARCAIEDKGIKEEIE